MPCTIFTPKYANRQKAGLQVASSRGDGYSVELKFEQAYPDPSNYTLAYNIYYSTDQNEVFNEGVKFISLEPAETIIFLSGFKPGDVVYFAVRATQFPPTDVRLSSLPEFEGSKIYPEAALTADIDEDDLLIPVEDIETFPPFGLVQIGAEIIKYSAIDLVDGNLLVGSLADRGYLDSKLTIHTTDGYDGYITHDNPLVRHFIGFEDRNILIQLVHNKFEYPNYPRTDVDGYKDKVDVVYGKSSLDSIDAENADLPRADLSGWRRNHPQEVISGNCIGSYIGGEFFCADGYEGVGRRVRGISLSEQNNQRLETLLETTGDPVILLRRQVEGKVSSHYRNTSENLAYRGLDNFGTDLVHGYEQFFSPRRVDGKILVRFGPTKENIKADEPGLENEFIPNCWTLPFPILKDRDIIIRFNKDGTEEWRYEIIDVERNRLAREGNDETLATESSAQKFTAVRIRKTDPINQVKIFINEGNLPEKLDTTVGFTPGPGGIPPHTHEIYTDNGVLKEQMTSTSAGHQHVLNSDGVIVDILGHTHSVIIP